MDHWSEAHVLFQKSAEEVALSLLTKVFCYFGPPRILQSDNGRKFVKAIIRKVVYDWSGEVTIVNGRAHHPQSQGFVERANAKVEQMLACHFNLVTAADSLWALRFSVKLINPRRACAARVTVLGLCVCLRLFSHYRQ